MAPPNPTTIRLAQGTALLLSSVATGVSLSISVFGTSDPTLPSLQKGQNNRTPNTPPVIPRLLESPTPLMLTQWSRTYHLGHATVPVTAAVAATSYLWLGLRAGLLPARARLYLTAGALTLGIVPYTMLFMLPTNKKLHALEERGGVLAVASVATTAAVEGKGKGAIGVEEERGAKGLMDWWGVLNLGRAGLLLGGAVCGLVATL